LYHFKSLITGHLFWFLLPLPGWDPTLRGNESRESSGRMGMANAAPVEWHMQLVTHECKRSMTTRMTSGNSSVRTHQQDLGPWKGPLVAFYRWEDWGSERLNQ
jgi:hypothetical protein